jgi:predicted GTPase
VAGAFADGAEETEGTPGIGATSLVRRPAEAEDQGMRQRVLIMGAAGRDFHNFNVVYRNDPAVEVVAFTATQIPFINDRRYPPELAGKLYPDGIAIHDESLLEQLIREQQVDEVAFSYSDVPHEVVMHKASQVLACGASFTLLGPRETMLRSKKPVVSVCAVRTGAGKSQTTRAVAEVLKAAGRRVVAIRHPMPYGDLAAQRVQRYAELADLDRYDTTIEEREEYEPHIVTGTVIYAGVDYADILAEAEAEADVILWDGGNNDLPFYTPDVHIVVVDPLRAGNETRYYPGEANLRMADVVIVNKVNTAAPEDVATLRESVRAANPRALVLEADSAVRVEHPELITGKRVLVVEDGPTLTHGEMRFGAGVVAARDHGAAAIVDPRPWAIGTIADTFAKYDVGPVLPAMGYSPGQLAELQQMINSADVDTVVIGTPIDLRRVIEIDKPAVRVSYDLEVRPGSATLENVLRGVC